MSEPLPPRPQWTSTWTLTRRLIVVYMRPHWRKLLSALGCMLVAAGATAAFAYLLGPVIDEIFTQRNDALLLPIALGILACFVARGACTYGQSVLMNAIALRIIARLQEQMFAKLVHAEVERFTATASGRMVSRFTYDVQQLSGSLTKAITGIGKDLTTALALIVVMLLRDWVLALAAIILLPLAFFPIARLGRRMRRISKTAQTEFGDLNSLLNQVFQGIRHVKANNAEDREIRRARGTIRTVSNLMQKQVRTRAASHPIMEVFGGVAVVAVILYGGSQVIQDNRSAGDLVSFITALIMAYEPLKRVATMNAVLQQGMAAAERVFALIDTEPTIADRPGATALPRAAGAVAFEGVTFSYHADAPALHGLDFAVAPGETVALVGPSGAGKSTVLNLIPRFFDVDAGTVRLDGHDVRDVTLASLRAQIALVSQEPSLFDDTIRGNIAYGRPDAPNDAIERAARDAAAHEFIEALPRGYDTEVGEHGVRLSGGQRQRIAIARAVLKDAPILLLDEATSALDTESERLVQEALARLMAGRTTILIAHRLSTVRHADRILVLDDGRLVEQGSHDRLLATGGLYSRLWRLQADGTTPDLRRVVG